MVTVNGAGGRLDFRRPSVKLLHAAVNIVCATAMVAAIALLLTFSAAPAVFGFKSYVVLSGSMEPNIHTGAVIFAEAVQPSSLQVGDVIVYNRSDANETVTHRIIDKQNDGSGKPTFTTKGDANSGPDPWTVQYPADSAGKVVFTIPYVGYVNHALDTPQGRTVFLVVPVSALAIMWLVQIWRPSKPAEPVLAKAQPEPNADSRDTLPLRR